MNNEPFAGYVSLMMSLKVLNYTLYYRLWLLSHWLVLSKDVLKVAVCLHVHTEMSPFSIFENSYVVYNAETVGAGSFYSIYI